MESQECSKIEVNKDSDDKSSKNCENFIIEYPLNYEEIVQRKLQQLEKEYNDTIDANIRTEDLNQSKDSDDSSPDQEKNPLSQEKETNPSKESEGYIQYQCLSDNEDDEFVEVNEECKNENINFLGETILNGQIPENSSRSQLEFIVCTHREVIQKRDDDELFAKSIKITIREPEKIKTAMKSIKMNPPKWAQKYVFYYNNSKLNNNQKLT
jgi:hypothetical protein